MDDNLDRIRDAATAFRAAIEACKGQLGIAFEEFPRGACGDTALLLARYLHLEGFGDFTYVSGERVSPGEDDFYTHAWLRQGDVIIDITADQFEGQPPVIVTKDSGWHVGFSPFFERPGDIDEYDQGTRNELIRAFHKILCRIPRGGLA
jgi:hypothetical protein